MLAKFGISSRLVTVGRVTGYRRVAINSTIKLDMQQHYVSVAIEI